MRDKRFGSSNASPHEIIWNRCKPCRLSNQGRVDPPQQAHLIRPKAPPLGGAFLVPGLLQIAAYRCDGDLFCRSICNFALNRLSHNSNESLKIRMAQPSETTRQRILKAAERLFAEHGYDATSIRSIVTKARVNQAAINYHFGGKDGLYRDLLRETLGVLTEHQLAHAQEMKEMPREKALGQFIRYQLRPLALRDDIARHLRILNWEAVRPTAVYRKLLSEEPVPFIGRTVDLVRRFMPEADEHTLITAAIWMMGQCSIFIRYREQLANPPTSLVFDGAAIEWLAERVTTWLLGGLAQSTAATVSLDLGMSRS